MSLHHVRTSSILPPPNTLRAENVELSEHSSHQSSVHLKSGFRTSTRGRSTSWKRLHASILARVSSFWTRVSGLWTRVTELWARVNDSFIDGWAGEILSVLLSLVAFMTIVVLLRMYDDRKPPSWPQHLTLNFVVSTLATVVKSSLLFAIASALGQFKWLWMSSKQRRLQDLQVFDEASRGPLGALKLISRRYLSWASIGALITILCLIFDPFIQGLISVSERVVYKNDPASLVNRIVDYPELLDYEYTIAGLDYPTVNVINNAVFNRNPLQEISPQCPSGNCTFPPFESLGFCSKCQDISQPLRDNSKYIDNQRHYACENKTTKHRYQCNFTERTYTYSLPQLNGQVLIPNDEYLPEAHNGSSFYSFITDTYPRPLFLVIALDFKESFEITNGTSTSIFTMVLFIRISDGDLDPGAILEANLCSFGLCAQKRNVSLFLNQPSSTILQTVYDSKTFQRNLGDVSNPSWLLFNGDGFNMTFPSNLSKLDEEAIVNADAVHDCASFTKAVVDILCGNMTRHGPADAIEIGVTSNIIGGLNASSNISMTMDNVATALTNYFRASSNATITGQSGQVEFYIHVSWPWIALPLLLVIAGAFILAVAIYESKRCRIRVWKTSELPLLFHGFEEQYQEMKETHKASEMEHLASEARVKMAKISANGWALRRHDNPTEPAQRKHIQSVTGSASSDI